jgi:hypothetical protein
VPVPFPPHVAEGVKESRALYDIVKQQDRQGAMGIVQGERALSRIEHAAGHQDTDLPVEKGLEVRPQPEGSAQGMGSRDQADITPGETPTRKGEGE